MENSSRAEIGRRSLYGDNLKVTADNNILVTLHLGAKAEICLRRARTLEIDNQTPKRRQRGPGRGRKQALSEANRSLLVRAADSTIIINLVGGGFR